MDYRTAFVPRAGTTAVIGNFDGVHVGHQALLARAAAHGLGVCVLTFDPHPARFFAPDAAPRMLCTAEDKQALLAHHGVEWVLDQRFDAGFAQLSPHAFVEQVLVKSLGVDRVVIGYDFRFGAKRAGDVQQLKALAEIHGVKVDVVEALEACGGVVSSSRIRSLVREGDVSQAGRLLGRPYHLTGQVVTGAQRGRQLGFPTANLQLHSELPPAQGVYSGWLDWGEGPTPAVVNNGMNPTFGGTQPVVEAHVIDKDQLDLYGRRGVLYFGRRLRAERRFPNPAALRAQIAADRDAARRNLASQRKPKALF